MFSFLKRSDPVVDFWNRFSGKASAIAMAIEARDEKAMTAFVHELTRSIHRIDDRLCFEVGKGVGDEFEFTVTPDGGRDLIPLAERVSKAAPSLKGWRIFALKQRKPVSDLPSMRFGDFEISTPKIGWIAHFGSNAIKIHFYYDAPRGMPQNLLCHYSNVLLDAALGEYDSIMNIANVNAHIGVNKSAQPFANFVAAHDEWKARRDN